MDELPKPMLNQPIETGMTAGEEFEQNVLGRLEGARDARVKLQDMTAEDPKAQMERIAKFKEESFARIEKASGLTFDRETGRCTTPTQERGDSRQFRARWKRV